MKLMINEYTKINFSEVLHVINDASLRYKGVIPDNCWHEPYMSEQELINEFNNKVHIFGYHKNDKLVGVIGVQEVKDVILIRHAYILSSYQGQGAGSALLEHLLNIPILRLFEFLDPQKSSFSIGFIRFCDDLETRCENLL